MKRYLGIARCGLACCLCSENTSCSGCCGSGCPGADGCENRRCSMERGLEGCWACGELDICSKGLLAKPKPRGFSRFARRYGVQALLDCLERGERAGLVYHRAGVEGDYDGFDCEEELISFLWDGQAPNEKKREIVGRISSVPQHISGKIIFTNPGDCDILPEREFLRIPAGLVSGQGPRTAVSTRLILSGRANNRKVERSHDP